MYVGTWIHALRIGLSRRFRRARRLDLAKSRPALISAELQQLEVRLLLSANTPPELSIGNQTIPHTQETLTIDLPQFDADGDPLSYTAEIQAGGDPLAIRAYELDQELGLYKNGSYGQDWGGWQERWMQSASQTPYFITPDGTFYRWGGSMSGSTMIAEFDPSYYDDPTKLHEAPLPELTVDAQGSTAAVVGNQLIISPGDGFLGNFNVTVTVTDGAVTDSETFNVSVTNTPPELSIGNQTIPHTQETLTIDLPQFDADGDPLSYTAEIQAGGDPLAIRAYELDQELGLYKNGSYGQDWGGWQERWMQSASQTPYFITPDGTFYRWGGSMSGSTMIAEFDPSYYDDPTKLHEAPLPELTVDAQGSTAAVVGNQLIISPGDGFLGNFNVTVTVTDGAVTDSETFNVSVTNTPPELSIGNQTIPHTQETLTIDLPQFDADGDPLSYTAEIQAGGDPLAIRAYELDQELGLYKNGSYGQDWGGWQERWMQSASQTPYFITPDGTFYRWGGSMSGSTMIAEFDPSYYDDPTKLHEAPLPELTVDAQGSTAAVVGNQLIITPGDGFLGNFNVTVTVTDGAVTDSETFNVSVTNTPPELSIGNQTIPHTQETLTIDLPQFDADGDPLSYTAEIQAGGDPLAIRAYELDQELGLYKNGSYGQDWGGWQERWMQSASQTPYFITPDGTFYRWGGSMSGSTMIAEFDPSYYDDPTKLHEAPLPELTVDAQGSTAAVVGNQLIITPGDGFLGNFNVTVTVTDGAATVSETFTVQHSADPMEWANPLIKQGYLGSPLVEVTPFVWDGELYLLENWRSDWNWADQPGDGQAAQNNEMWIARLPEGAGGYAERQYVAPAMTGHTLGTAIVWDGIVYVFGVQDDSGSSSQNRRTKVDVTWSSDLVNWSQPMTVLDSPAGEIFNVAVTRDDDGFAFLWETNGVGAPFTMMYGRVDNLTDDWNDGIISGAVYGQNKYTGGPALYYEDGWYYTLYLEQLTVGRWETRITRSRDLLQWQDAPHDRTFITFDHSRTNLPLRPSTARETNASDAELAYFQGMTIVFFTGSDQVVAGDLQWATFDGTPRELFEYFFV